MIQSLSINSLQKRIDTLRKIMKVSTTDIASLIKLLYTFTIQKT